MVISPGDANLSDGIVPGYAFFFFYPKSDSYTVTKFPLDPLSQVKALAGFRGTGVTRMQISPCGVVKVLMIKYSLAVIFQVTVATMWRLH